MTTSELLAQLPLAQRHRADELDGIMAALPVRGVTAHFAATALQAGLPEGTFRRLYYQWRKHGILGLVDRRVHRDRKAGAGGTKATPQIIRRYQELCEMNQRKSAPAYRALVAELRAGRVPERDIPSISTLRPHTPARAELALHRRGFTEAKRHLPKLLTTRVGLHVGSHYLIDDMWHDMFGRLGAQTVRPVALHILDLFSAHLTTWGVRPRLERADGTKGNLTEAETRFLLASHLFNHGYSPQGTALVVEHGTAAVREKLEDLLLRRTDGLITVQRSGFEGDIAAVAGAFAGKRKGQSNFKAALESLHNLIHNETGFLPAQTGMTKEHRPEDTNAMLAYTTEIASLAAALPPEVAQNLLYPVAEWHSQLLPTLTSIYQAINHRTAHRLEGWSRCGHVITEFRADPHCDQWFGGESYLSLPPADRTLLSLAARQNPQACTRIRQLSPAEVWHRGSRGLQRIRPATVAEILTLHGDLDPAHFREAAVHAGRIQFQDQSLDAEPLIYDAVIEDAQGEKREAPFQSKFLACRNPFDLAHLFLFDARGAFAGIVRRTARPARDAVHHSHFGALHQRRAALLQDTRSRHAAHGQAMAHLREHNARLLDRAQSSSVLRPPPSDFRPPSSEFRPPSSDLDAALAARAEKAETLKS